MQGSERAEGVAGSRRAGVAPALFLTLLLVAAFHGALAGRMFYLRDISQNHYPIRHYVTERLRAFSLPLWDPYHGGGTPLLANPNALVLHPISLLFLALPFNTAFTASIVLQFALMAAGGYALARATGAGREGSALASAVMTLSGPAASLASQHNVLSAAAWVPIGVCAFVQGLEPARRRCLPLAALCLAVVIVTGEAASLLAFLLLAAGLALTRPSPVEAPRRGGLSEIGALLWVLLLASGLAAAQILPARALLPLSARGGGFSPAEAFKWSLEPRRLLEVVLPQAFGDPTRLSPQAWWGRFLFEGGYPFLFSIHVGIIPCFLAALAFCGRGSGRVRRLTLGGIAALGILLALGRHSPLYRALFAAVPAARQVRYPERFLLVALFALALLAGLGLDRLLHGEPDSRRRAVRSAFGAAALAFVGLTLVAAWPATSDRLLEIVASVPEGLLSSEIGPVLRGAILRSSLWAFGGLALLAVGSALALRALPRPVEGVAGWSIVTIAGLCLWAASRPALSTAAPGWIETPSPLASIVGHGAGAARLHHEPRPDSLSVWATTDELAWGYRFDRFTYALASGHRDHVPTMLDAATDHMDLAPQAALGRDLDRLTLREKLRVLSVCGVGFLLAFGPLDDPDLEPIPALEEFSLPPTRIYRLRSTLPRARFVAAARAPSHPDDLAASLSDPGFEASGTVLLDGAGAGKGGGAPDPLGRVRILKDLPEEVVLRVDAPTGGYLVLSDAFAPGWDARVDSAPAPILRANGLFRAVTLPPGAHEVVMLYRPASVFLGLAISLVSALLAFGWWCRAGRSTP